MMDRIHALIHKLNDPSLYYVFTRLLELLRESESLPLSYKDIAHLCAMRSPATARRKILALEAGGLLEVRAQGARRKNRYALPDVVRAESATKIIQFVPARARMAETPTEERSNFDADYSKNDSSLHQKRNADQIDIDINNPHMRVFDALRDAIGIPSKSAMLLATKSGLSMEQLRGVVARCVTYKAASWKYVENAIRAEMAKAAEATAQETDYQREIQAMNETLDEGAEEHRDGHEETVVIADALTQAQAALDVAKSSVVSDKLIAVGVSAHNEIIVRSYRYQTIEILKSQRFGNVLKRNLELLGYAGFMLEAGAAC